MPVIHLPSCDGDGQAISVEIQPLSLRPIGLGIVLVDDPAENIWGIWRVLSKGISIATNSLTVLEND